MVMLGGFAQGLGAGLEEGADLRQKYEQRAAQKMAKLADQNYSAWLEQAGKSTPATAAPKPVAPPSPPAGGAPPPPMGGPPPGGGMPPVGGAPPMGRQGPAMPMPMGAPGGGMPPGAPPQGGAPPPNPGMAPQPQQPPRPMPMPGATPMPGAGPPPGGGGMMGGPPGAQAGGGGVPGANSPPPPRPQGPPMGGGAPPPGGQPPGQDPTNDPIAQSKQALQTIAQQLLQGFPGKKWKPGELLATVDSVLTHMDKVDPIAKQMAQLQLQYYKTQVNAQTQGTNRDERGREHDQSNDTRMRGQDMSHEDRQAAIKERLQAVAQSQAGQDRRAKLQAATRLQAEDMVQSGANGRAALVDQYRRDALSSGLDEKEWAEGIRAGLKEEGMDDAYVTKLFSAQSANAPAGKAPVAPARPVRKPLPAAPGRAAGGGPPPPPKPGEKRNGYTYKGGDPSLPASWAKG